MSDNLYDTGAPKRVIVEHRHTHEVTVVARSMRCLNCDRDTDVIPCRWCDYPMKTQKPVTITPEFQPVGERKRLK